MCAVANGLSGFVASVSAGAFYLDYTALFQPIRMKELSVISIYTQIASGQILLAVRSCALVAIFSKVEKAPPFFFMVQ